ncbi:MAG: YceH family protein [Planctomycetota bacterium]
MPALHNAGTAKLDEPPAPPFTARRMSHTLNAIERRVLGVLIEKALANPQYYPMSVNATVAGCNQKNNRDPVLELDEEAVWNALERLRAAGLVTRLLPGGASRVERYKHEVKELLGWEKPARAVMAELLLRGPQTTGELRTRCARMYPFDSPDAVAAVLDTLAQATPPWVATLPRAPGQSAVRYAHRLYEPDEWRQLGGAVSREATTPSAPQPVMSAPQPAHGPASPASARGAALEARPAAALQPEPASSSPTITEELAVLREEIASLRRRLDAAGL